jgi:hypothetical protein
VVDRSKPGWSEASFDGRALGRLGIHPKASLIPEALGMYLLSDSVLGETCGDIHVETSAFVGWLPVDHDEMYNTKNNFELN